MTFNNVGSNLFDAMGLPEGMLLTPNDAGSQKFDNMGLAESGLGTSQIIRLLASTGCGI